MPQETNNNWVIKARQSGLNNSQHLGYPFQPDDLPTEMFTEMYEAKEIESIKWEREKFLGIDDGDSTWQIVGVSETGKAYEAIGIYCLGELVKIEEIEPIII